MELSSKERIKNAINREIVDKIPVFPALHHNSTRVVGEKIKNFAENSETMTYCLLKAQEKYGYDGLCIGVDAAIEAEAIGSEVFQPNDAPAYVKKFFIDEKKKFNKLKKLINPKNEGRMPVIINTTKAIKEIVKDKLFIQSIIMGPVNLATQLRGPEKFLFDLMDDIEFTNSLLDYCLKQSIEYGKALIDAGADDIDIGEAFCSLNMISPEIYRNFALERHKKLIKSLKEYSDSITITLHICGDVTKILNDMAMTGADILDIDWQVDMGLATKFLACRGNLDPSRVLLSGNKELVLIESKKVIEKAASSKALILGSGCEIAPDTPSENIVAMVEAAEKFS